MCVGVLPVCMSIYHVHPWYLQRPEDGSDPLELALLTVVSHCVSTGNRTWVL